MNLFGFRSRENRDTADLLLQALVTPDTVTKKEALNIPSIAECLDVISGMVAMLPVKLYRAAGQETQELAGDPRVKLLNQEPGGLMDGFQMKKAWVSDYLMEGRGYLYIERERNAVTSLRYVKATDVSVSVSADPIYKTATLYVGGAAYRDYEFLKITRRTENGVTGHGILADHPDAIAVVYNALVYENFLVKTGGNKKGFLKSQKKLSSEAMAELKKSFKRLYRNNSENVVVLNGGLDFQESSSTSVEMQLNENKKTNAAEMCKLFNTPPSIIDGTAKEEECTLWAEICLNPIFAAIEAALNKDLLLGSEKAAGMYFAVDTKDLLKGNMLNRFTAYQTAVQNNFMGIDEVRRKEDLPPWGIDFIKLGLDCVLYDPKSKRIFTPNTGKTQDFAGRFSEAPLEGKGGEQDEN